MTTIAIPAAQYLRMSTDHQQYSLDNQAAAITRYAESHGFVVIRSYCDSARSGIVLKNRPGLKQLLQDVVATRPPYRAILVYDISRWGRFQDTDESAHYEFLCKSAGIPVHYCAETFANDTSLGSLIMKALKRTMAGEYSRELGVKVLEGQNRLVRLGFKQGGRAGFGMRRMLVSSDRRPKQLLENGERKSIASDRVILIPGPADEVNTVREIFKMYVSDRMPVYAIARELNRKGVEYTGLSEWDFNAVHQILSHPKYMGCNTFGRTSQRLHTRLIRRPPSEWTVSPRAFAPIVDEQTFQQAQRLLGNHTIHKSNEQMLQDLRMLLASKGRLSASIIDAAQDVASAAAYRARFRSLGRAYAAIGYTYHHPGPSLLHVRTRAMRNALARQIAELFPDSLKMIKRRSWRPYLKLRNSIRVSIRVVRSQVARRRKWTWVMEPVAHECKFVTLVALLDGTNRSFLNFYIFPFIQRRGRFVVTDDWLRTGERLSDLSQFCEAVSRSIIARSDRSDT
jgi:DNA invertase Pin-like site-specific DNA recombinase